MVIFEISNGNDTIVKKIKKKVSRHREYVNFSLNYTKRKKLISLGEKKCNWQLKEIFFRENKYFFFPQKDPNSRGFVGRPITHSMSDSQELKTQFAGVWYLSHDQSVTKLYAKLHYLSK